MAEELAIEGNWEKVDYGAKPWLAAEAPGIKPIAQPEGTANTGCFRGSRVLYFFFPLYSPEWFTCNIQKHQVLIQVIMSFLSSFCSTPATQKVRMPFFTKPGPTKILEI